MSSTPPPPPPDFLSLVEPEDQSLALHVVGRLPPMEGKSLATQCNAFLCGLALSNNPVVLDKAFAYLGKMRAYQHVYAQEGQTVPSVAARDALIWSSGRLVRGLGLTDTAPKPTTAKQRRSAAASKVDTDQVTSKFVGLSETLFYEHMTAATEALRRGDPANTALTTAYQADAKALLSAMIYLYIQANKPAEAVALFQQMRQAADHPVGPVLPDQYAMAGVVKALAQDKGPFAAWRLLTDVVDGPQRMEIALTHKVYDSIIEGIHRQLRKVKYVGRDAQDLQALSHRVLEHMQRKAGLPLKVGMWRRFFKIETRFGNWRRIQEYMEAMRAQGLELTPWEYAMLIDALGEAKRLEQLPKIRAKMKEEGVSLTYVVYLSIIMAHGKSFDVRGAQAAYEELQRETAAKGSGGSNSSHQIEVVTSMMRLYVQAGLPQKAWDLFQSFQEGGGKGGGGQRPDDVMYAVAFRAASSLGGLPMVEQLNRERKEAGAVDGGGEREGGRARKRKEGGSTTEWGTAYKVEDTLSLSLLAAYVDAGEWDQAYQMLDDLTSGKEKGLSSSSSSVSIEPFNILIHGLTKRGRYEEARTVAERARALGLIFNAVTLKGLAKTMGAEELWTPPAHVYVLGGKEERKDGGRKEKEGGREETAEALVLDLHTLSLSEAHALLAREFEAMRLRFDAEEGKEEEEEEDRKEKVGNGGLKDLVLITGFRRRVGRGQGAALLADQSLPIVDTKAEVNAMQEAVRNFLGVRGIYWVHPSNNRGRLLVQQAALREYFERQKKSESEVKFFRLTLGRYIPVASLMALFFLVPKGGLPL